MSKEDGGSRGNEMYPVMHPLRGPGSMHGSMLPQEAVFRIPMPNLHDFQGGSSGEPEPSLQDLVKILTEHWRRIAMTVLVFVSLAVFYCLIATKTYTASSTLEIAGYDPVIPNSALENNFGQQSRKLEYVKTQIAKLSRMSVADEVLSTDNLAEDLNTYFSNQSGFVSNMIRGVTGFISSLFSSSEAEVGAADEHYQHDKSLLQQYLSLVSIRPVEETSLVEIAVTTADPRLSQRIANAHGLGFIEHLRKERHTSTLSNLRFLQTQADELQDKVAGAEENLAKYAEKNELITLSKDQNLVVAQMGELSQLLAQATAERIKSESVLGSIEAGKAINGQTILPNNDDHSIQVLQVSLQEAQTEYANLNQKLMPAHPTMQQLAAKIASLKSTIELQRRQVVGALKAKYQSDLEAEKRLTAQIENQKLLAHETSKRQVQYNILEREYESLKDLYQTVLRQLKEAQISSASSGVNISITDFAALPLFPSGPMRGLILTLSAICGLGLGIVVALGLNMLDNTIKTGEDVQSILGLPSLGLVPSFDARPSAPTIPSDATSLPFAGATPVNGNGASSNGKSNLPVSSRQLFALTFPQAMVSEAFRTIRTSLLFSSADRPPRIVMITSAKKGEGKTTFASNLGISLAQASHRTLIIDADIRQAKIHERFNIPADVAGLSDYLAGQAQLAEVVSDTGIQNLQVITAGSSAPNPAELLGSEKMAQLVELLAVRYDYILIDSPPVLPVADSLILSRAVDGVVLVLRSGETEKHLALEASRRLRRVHAPILGVVLNDVDVSKEYRGYGEAYGYVVPNAGGQRRAGARM